MVFKIDCSCGSFIGNGRNNNEDNFYFNKKHLPLINKGLKNPIKCEKTTGDPVVFAVFDGIGGESNGEEAAYVASEIFGKESKILEEIAMSGKEYMYRTCEKANNSIDKIRTEKHLKTMGTTVAAVFLSQDEIVACNVGDSKIFRIRDKKMIQISEDHTDEKILASIGINKKPVLLQYLGLPATEMIIEPFASKGDIRKDDAYVLCSDGVTDVLDVNKIYEIVCNNNADDAVRFLLAEVDKDNGTDNATVIVIKVI